VLSLHVRHAHVSCRGTTIDHTDVLLPRARTLKKPIAVAAFAPAILT
jgi:hypothetical protein